MDALVDAAPDDDNDWEARRQALAECMKGIAPKARKVAELRYSEGLVPGEIAKALSWSMGAVNVQLSRVRKFLRECSRRKLGMEEI